MLRILLKGAIDAAFVDGNAARNLPPTAMVKMSLGDADMGREPTRGLDDRNSAICSRKRQSRCSVHALLRGIQKIGKRSLGAGNV